MFLRQDSAFIEEKLEFIEPVMGLFHVQTNMLKLMIMTYWVDLMQRTRHPYNTF